MGTNELVFKTVNYWKPKCPKCKEDMFEHDPNKFWCWNFDCDVLWRYGNRG